MATTHCNFSEKALDTWVRETLDGYTKDPEAIPRDGDAWISDRGGKNSVPGLRLRLRLRRDGGRFTVEAPHCGFYLLRKVNGKKRSLLIGDRAIYTVEMAREQAVAEQQDLSKGIDKRADRKRQEQVDKALALTYREALNAFLEQADVAESTKTKYRLSLTTTFSKRADRPLVELTEHVVKTLHQARSKESPSRADQDFRVLRLVWNWARDEYRDADKNPLLGDNPVVKALNKRRSAGATKTKWNNVARRETIIPEARLGEWFDALDAIRADPDTLAIRARTADLLEALALSGLRFNELAKLTWDRVDFGLGTITIPPALSKNRRPLIRPMTRRLREILEHRSAERDRFPDTTLVFPGRSKDRPIFDPRKLHEAIEARTGLTIVAHDVRRVFASAALRAGVSQIVLKRLLNHLTNTQEVTEGYQVLSLDALREDSQKIEDHILGKAGRLSSRGMDDRLQDLLSALPEDEKRLLIFELAKRQHEAAA